MANSSGYDMILSQNITRLLSVVLFGSAALLLESLSSCQRIHDWTKKQSSTMVSSSQSPAAGPALSESLQTVSNAWKTPTDLAMSASAICVRSATGSVACAKLMDPNGPHFRPLNLLWNMDGFLADRLNLCVARGAETYCLGDALWLPTNAQTNDFGVFRRAFALDGADHLGRINTDPARWSKDGTFTVRSIGGGGDYVVDNIESWTAAHTSREEACGLTREGNVLCYQAKEVSVKSSEGQDSTLNKVSLSRLAPVSLPNKARKMALSESYCCALLEGGQVYCWLPPMVGGNDQRLAAAGVFSAYPHALSAYDSSSVEPASRVAGKMKLPAPATLLVSGTNFVCALAQDGMVYCFGGNNWGQLGQVRPIAGSRQPLPVQGLGNVVHLAAAESSVCAIDTSSSVYCWGKLTTKRRQLYFSRVPQRITENDLDITTPERRTCPEAMQVHLQPEDWARQLKEAKDPIEQARLLDQMQMFPAKSPDSSSVEPPALKRVALVRSRNGFTSPSTWLVRTDWTIGTRELSTRSQLLVPVSSETYCAVAPNELASIDREQEQRPCRSHPSLGNFEGPYRARFITLTSEDHWTLEVLSASGRVDPLTDDEFHYELTYYDQVGFDVQQVFNMELFGGTCGKIHGDSPPGVDIARTFKLTHEMPRKIEIQECEPGKGCKNTRALYVNGEYHFEEPPNTPDDPTNPQ